MPVRPGIASDVLARTFPDIFRLDVSFQLPAAKDGLAGTAIGATPASIPSKVRARFLHPRIFLIQINMSE